MPSSPLINECTFCMNELETSSSEGSVIDDSDIRTPKQEKKKVVKDSSSSKSNKVVSHVFDFPTLAKNDESEDEKSKMAFKKISESTTDVSTVGSKGSKAVG